MRYRFDPVKADGGDEDEGQDGNPSGGCGDGDGCGRQYPSAVALRCHASETGRPPIV
ncbi:hypothetical protein SNOUR_16800 [Streptomyces noursei ATCC 11455]|nr:hypothetical protein SNOUR_16800 [Streptomyces noursei ATCC 11455]